MHQRRPESPFQTPTPLLFRNFWIWVGIRVRLFFKFVNPTPVLTAATIIHPTLIYTWFYLRNDRTDSCYCRNGKVTHGPFFYKFLTSDPGPKEKRKILPESTPVLRIQSHLCHAHQRCSGSDFFCPTPVLIQEEGILIRILFATQLWNPNPEKMLLTYLSNQCASIQNFCFWKVRSGYRFISGLSYLKSYSSVTCNVTLTHDECVVKCTRFGINALNPKPKPKL